MDDAVHESGAEASEDGPLEHAPCGYLVTTLPKGQIVQVNRTLCAWLGYTREELEGQRRFVELLTPAGKVFQETHYAPLLYLQGDASEIAFDFVCKDGLRLPVLLNSQRHGHGPDEPGVVRTAVFKATQRRSYERELLHERREAERALSEKASFLAMVSHEIRSPLQCIMSAYEVLDTRACAPEQARYLNVLRESSQHLLRLANDLLDWGKLEAGKLVLNERLFDLREAVHGVVEGLRARAKQKGNALSLHVDERVPRHVYGDPVKIAQVLVNLVSNAVRFTTRGTVRVDVQVQELEPQAASLRFSVSDTGIGIPHDRLRAIFEEYTQASLSTAVEYGGTGLGLAISRGLLELYSASIVVESAPGRGSVFSFGLRLPTEAPSSP